MGLTETHLYIKNINNKDLLNSMGFPGHSVVKNQSPANAGDVGSIPGLGKSPWKRKWQRTPISLPGKFHGQRSGWAVPPGVTKELDMT